MTKLRQSKAARKAAKIARGSEIKRLAAMPSELVRMWCPVARDYVWLKLYDGGKAIFQVKKPGN